MSAKRKIIDITKRIFDHTKLKIFQNMKANGPTVPVGGLSRGPQQAMTSTTMIAAETVVKGDVSGKENLRIEGKFEGTVNLPGGEVTIGEAAQVTADITAKAVTLGGNIKGEINGVEKIIISKTGRVQGNVSGPRVILEDGGQFTGRIDMNLTEVEKVTTGPKFPVKSKSVEQPDNQAKRTS